MVCKLVWDHVVMGLHIIRFGQSSRGLFFILPAFSSCRNLKLDGLGYDDNTSLEYFTGDRSSTDWDKAWSSFRKQGKKSLFSQFNPNKYVSWNPRRSDYPLSEEVDPIKRTERSNLMLWTSPRFTLFGAIIVVSLLLIYTLSAPMK
ncbi:hypothetical protein Syun_001187 [Stephania yunnanensis]|uniref:Uncharacterized protein n=1 Tax=Stephania yunnanensis TaxID=152371 RepID=A0AAP0LD94_9MAGN